MIPLGKHGLARYLQWTLPVAALVSGIALAQTESRSRFSDAIPDSVVRTADQFATSISPRGTEEHARAFQAALSVAAKVTAQVGLSQPTGRAASSTGDLLRDPRYLANQAAMLGDATPKIWRGTRVAEGDFPDVVAITGGSGLCTGTLIADAVVLTARHCVCDRINQFVVVGNEVSRSKTRVRVLKSVTMRACNAPLAQGDVALLFLETPISVKLRPLATTSLIDVQRVVVAVGFGRTDDPANEPLGIKRFVDLPVASVGCEGMVQGATDSSYYGCTPTEEIVAGIPSLDRDTCNGDSGGPLLARSANGDLALAAVVSRAVVRPGLAECGDGGIYARVDRSVATWIAGQGVKVSSSTATAEVPAKPSLKPPAAEVGGVSLTQEQEEALRKLPDGEVTLLGKLVRHGLSSVLLVSPGIAVGLPVVNAREIGDIATNTPNTNFSIRRTNEGVRVLNVTIPAVQDLDASAVALRKAGYPETAEKVADLSRAANIASKPGPDSGVRADAVREQATPTEESIVEDYLKTLAQLEAATGARAREIRETQKTLAATFTRIVRALRATYGRDDRYKPAIYEHIRSNSKGGVALRTRDGATKCSGALIADDLVITARHCFSDVPASAFDVVFDWEVDLQNKSLDQDVYPVASIYYKPAPAIALDYAIVKVGKRQQNQPPPGARWPVQCFDNSLVLYGDPLYVVGHPLGGARLVADNSIVLFPYQVTRSQFAKLHMRVTQELQGQPDDPITAEKAALLQDFLASYKEDQQTGMYENRRVKYGGYPTIGADTDTFEGNSGSPVYRRTTNKIVGILYRGESDLGRSLTPGWSRHEMIIPITEIIQDLDKNKKEWRNAQNLCPVS